MNNFNFSYNGHEIRVRDSDRYVSLSDLARASGKRVSDWLTVGSTEIFLWELRSSTGVPVHGLIEVSDPAIWGHPKAGICFAQSCSDRLALQVVRQIEGNFY